MAGWMNGMLINFVSQANLRGPAIVEVNVRFLCMPEFLLEAV